MKATYDPRTDTLTSVLKPGPVAESDEDKPGVVLDYDAAGDLVGIEILDASKRVHEARSMQFQVAGRRRGGAEKGEDEFPEEVIRLCKRLFHPGLLWPCFHKSS